LLGRGSIFSQEMTMLSVSYAVAATAMFGAALYLFFRLRPYVTTTTMLVGSLLLIYGPAFLSFTLTSGEPGFLIYRLSGLVGDPHPIFAIIKGKVADFDSVIIAMNFSIALMYASIIAGIEAVDRLFPKRIATMQSAVTGWSAQPLHDDVDGQRILLIVILALAALMLFFSITEDHIATIRKFLSIPGGDNNAARNLFRLHFATSPNYFYRLILAAVAPMFVIWGFLAGGLSRSWPLLLAAFLLFIATMIGKFDTLSKAPPAFFLVQLMVAALLTFTNRITWRSALAGACLVALVLYAVTRLIMVLPEGTAVQTVYSRVFEAENQSLLENFATFPFMHPHMWGADIRPFAFLMRLQFIPGYSIVAHTWYGTYDVSSPALFIADAWADFSYAGVIVFSLIAGAVCRLIDAIFLVRGKTVVGVAVLGATFMGVFTLLVTALNTALLSGGLLLAPILAALLVAAIRYFQLNPKPIGHAAPSE
jgi:hypothetical protein